MKAAVVVCICLTLLVTVSQANFYGKRAMGDKSLQDLIQDMRRQQQAGAEEVLTRIEELIKDFRAAHPARVLRSAENDH